MKQISQATTISILFLLITSHASARLLPPQQQGSNNPGTKPQEITMEDEFSHLMGLEQCGEKDDACLRRRMVTEAHLDYIYTQQQNP